MLSGLAALAIFYTSVGSPLPRSRSNKAREDELPWAEQLLRKKKSLRPASVHSESSESGESTSSQEELASPEDEAALWRQMEGLRAELEDPKLQTGDFVVKVLEGSWTIRHKGVGADAIQGTARSAEATEFCKMLGVPKSARYEIAAYGSSEAGVFPRTCVAKMQHFFNLASRSGQPWKAVPAEHIDSWEEPSEFAILTKALAKSKAAMGRVQQIRSLFRP